MGSLARGPPLPLPASGGPWWAAPRLRRPGHTSSFPEKVRWAGRLPVPKPQPARVRTRVPARGSSQSQRRRNPRTPPRRPEAKATLQHRTPCVSARAPVFVGQAAAAGPAHPIPARSRYTGAECAGPVAKTPEPAGVSQTRPRAFTHARSSALRGRPCAPAHTCAGVRRAPS